MSTKSHGSKCHKHRPIKSSAAFLYTSSIRLTTFTDPTYLNTCKPEITEWAEPTCIWFYCCKSRPRQACLEKHEGQIGGIQLQLNRVQVEDASQVPVFLGWLVQP